jgi:hypothetical protein
VPRYRYFLETVDMPVFPDHPAWRSVLPTRRCSFRGDTVPDEEAPIALEDYFGAVRCFLEGPDGQAAIRMLARRTSGTAVPDEIHIFLSKHGEYYHAARVVLEVGQEQMQMVINLAASEAGKTLIQKEYGILERLNHEYSPSYLPEVYAIGSIDIQGKRPVAMFLGQWFAGFHEFHLTRGRTGSEPPLAVWDPAIGHRLLSQSQIRTLYAQVAKILNYYFNPLTGECIGSWHHAAGDFVVRLSGSGLEVRLVTVRQYRPLFKADLINQDFKTRLDALLVFFLHLTLRTRLDRLDGVGDIEWAGPMAVEGTLIGTLEALAQKAHTHTNELPMIDAVFHDYLLLSSEADLLDICTCIVSTYHPQAPELPILKAHLIQHAADLAQAISKV